MQSRVQQFKNLVCDPRWAVRTGGFAGFCWGAGWFTRLLFQPLFASFEGIVFGAVTALGTKLLLGVAPSAAPIVQTALIASGPSVMLINEILFWKQVSAAVKSGGQN